jgi:CheY-like chemotaxis protein
MRQSSKSKSGVTARVLLVDDNSDGLLVRKAILEEQGCVITTATNGEEALEAFTKGKFDLMITDFRMPKMNGIELIRRVRPAEPAVAIILISGFVEALGLDEKTTGADAVVNKGAHEIPNLLRSVTRLLARQSAKKPPASQKAAKAIVKARAKSV